MEQKKFLTADEVFQLFGVNEEALADLVDSGAVKALANLGSFKYRSEDFVALVAEGKLKPRADGEMFQPDSAGSIPFLILDDDGLPPKMDEDLSFLELDEAALNEQANPSSTGGEVPVFTGDDFTQKSDSDVRLVTTPQESDSDVQLVSVPSPIVDSPIEVPHVKVSANDSDSDVRIASSPLSLADSGSDVQLISVPSPIVDSPIAVPHSGSRESDSDSDVRMSSSISSGEHPIATSDARRDARDSDSDVRLTSSLSNAPDSDSDVQLSSSVSSGEHPIATSGARLDASDSDVVLVTPDPQSLSKKESSKRNDVSNDQPTESEIAIVDADSGISLVDADSGISLVQADSGISLESADSGISLVDADSGISLVQADSGISLGGHDSGISLNDADSGISLVGADSGISVVDVDSGIGLARASDRGNTRKDNDSDAGATLSEIDSQDFDFANLGGDDSDGSGTVTLDISDESPNDSGFDVSLEEPQKTVELDVSDIDSAAFAKTDVSQGPSRKTSRGPTLSETFKMDEPPEVEDLDIADDLDTAVTNDLSGEFAAAEEFEDADDEVFEASDDVFSAAEMSASEIEEVAESEDELPAPKVRARPSEPAWGLMAVIPIACAALFMAVTATVLWGGIATMWTGGEAPTPAGMLISTLAGLSPF
ncbi:MAG: hypothetical protein WCH39_08390 [Schlesneria sp.]